MGNRITRRISTKCVDDASGRPQNARVFRSMPEWSIKHRQADAIFGTANDVAVMYTDYELAEELAQDFDLIDAQHELGPDLRNSSFATVFVRPTHACTRKHSLPANTDKSSPVVYVPGVLQRMVGLFGAEPGTWKYDVSKYFHRMRTEIKPTAHTVHYLKELSEESLRSRVSEVRGCASPYAGSLPRCCCLLIFDLVHTSKRGQMGCNLRAK